LIDDTVLLMRFVYLHVCVRNDGGGLNRTVFYRVCGTYKEALKCVPFSVDSNIMRTKAIWVSEWERKNNGDYYQIVPVNDPEGMWSILLNMMANLSGLIRDAVLFSESEGESESESESEDEDLEEYSESLDLTYNHIDYPLECEEKLEQQIGDVETNVGVLESRVESLRTRLADLRSQEHDLEKEEVEMQREISQAEADLIDVQQAWDEAEKTLAIKEDQVRMLESDTLLLQKELTEEN